MAEDSNNRATEDRKDCGGCKHFLRFLSLLEKDYGKSDRLTAFALKWWRAMQ